jgi:hypothetical protein
MSLLRLAARGTPLPTDFESPLLAPLSAEEITYHAGCLVSEPATSGPQ